MVAHGLKNIGVGVSGAGDAGFIFFILGSAAVLADIAGGNNKGNVVPAEPFKGVCPFFS